MTDRTDFDFTVEDKQFDNTAWIGKNRKYPIENVPAALEQYMAEKLEIPKLLAQAIIPADSLPIGKLLLLNLPAVKNATLVNPNAQHCFTKLPANSSIEHFKSCPIPSPTFLKELENAAKQAILDEAQSVEDPEFPGSRLPLWCIQAWKACREMVEIEGKWRGCLKWLDSMMVNDASLPVLQDARIRLLAMGWNERMDIPGSATTTRTTHLMRLFGEQISATLVEMMVGQIKERLERKPELDANEIVVDLYFMQQIDKAQDASYFDNPSKYLRRLEKHIISSPGCRLWIPCFRAALSHWTPFRINFSDKEPEIYYGDSLSHKNIPRPDREMMKLNWWLERRFKRPFRDSGDALEHGLQDDLVVCGMVMMNTFEHGIFGDPMWNVSRKTYDRARWFNRLQAAHEELKSHVSLSRSQESAPLPISAPIQHKPATENPIVEAETIEFHFPSDWGRHDDRWYDEPQFDAAPWFDYGEADITGPMVTDERLMLADEEAMLVEDNVPMMVSEPSSSAQVVAPEAISQSIFMAGIIQAG
ncbi:hypothetical protein C8J56DRAFT_1086435 [Mycena floridula]|nr:hypothetical protein C8J56DRAFT_1086435 [Mycena floridula]